ncbi:hypothetical protein PG991_015502 [Apiospora marii]|uniref:Zn(2)-C6 fungal-type domain-containing protein n=1 Tax=Apiospora marii TaxID=335849 RepID=A0ABR1R2I1_9PEZI
MRTVRASGVESKLRSSCDRCHELKNRCARGDDAGGRCERCDRLDIECVYSGASRIGRPPGKRPTIAVNMEDNSRPPKKQLRSRDGQARFDANATSPNPTPSATVSPTKQTQTVSTISHPNSGLVSTQSNEAAWIDQTYTLAPDIDRPEEAITPLYDWLSPEFDFTRSETPSIEVQPLNEPPPSVDPKWLSVLSTIPPGAGTINRGVEFSVAVADRFLGLQTDLLKLQNHLGSLASTGPSTGSGQVPDDEALASTQGLVDLSHAFVRLGMPKVPASTTRRVKGSSLASSFPYPVLGSESSASCHVTILQLLTCYAYLLQTLDLFVARLMLQFYPPFFGPSDYEHI